MNILHSYGLLARIFGWVGSTSYIVAYFLLSIKKLSAGKPLYHILNVLGALGLIFDALYLNDLPNLFVNVLWALIAFYAIFRMRQQ